MSVMTLKVNGRSHTVDVDPATPLLYVLSDDLALRGPKFGCGLGQCGACTVIMNGQATRSCVTPVQTVGTSGRPPGGPGASREAAPLSRLSSTRGSQCGFCSARHPHAKAVLDRNPKATDGQCSTRSGFCAADSATRG